MSQISTEKRNEIAFDLMTILAMNRKPNTDFLEIFASKTPSDEAKKKTREMILNKYAQGELQEFFIALFRSGFDKNIELFTEEFNKNMKELNERKEAEQNGPADRN